VNRELEVRLGSRNNGPIEFVECEPAVEALVDVLDRYTKEFPNDGLLALWIDDALAGAMHTYSKAKIPVSIILGNSNEIHIPLMSSAPRLEC
jgi:hypothetical protein